MCVMQTTKCVICNPIVWYHRNWCTPTATSAVVVSIGRHNNSTRIRQHSRIASERDRADAIFVCDYRNGTRQRKYAAVPRAHPSGRCCSCSTAAASAQYDAHGKKNQRPRSRRRFVHDGSSATDGIIIICIHIIHRSI